MKQWETEAVNHHLCIQMQLCEENLEERLKAKRKEFISSPKSTSPLQTMLFDQWVLEVFEKICNGLAYMKSKGNH